MDSKGRFFPQLFLVLALVVPCVNAQQGDNAYLQRRDSLLQERQKLNQTIWAQETEAQRHEDRLVALWDALLGINRAGKGDKFQVFKDLGLDQASLGKPSKPSQLDHGITLTRFGKGSVLKSAAWLAWLANTQIHGSCGVG